ncbi:Piso0_001383 [Millerozyma farinosa CBS 7064]|uniref:Piso0_001383 protein n=1 Tax=Pichia sorbitophila (strain ATCC MYA-4447 / BCRC 22081 / CBS 7064 / NBRC 10061 / NRRL Y-12695) TaxID=559304 RepID=G8YN08_PICSO|nr:Piso0_001383 [Millerozyma farinosa CBS 7064]
MSDQIQDNQPSNDSIQNASHISGVPQTSGLQGAEFSHNANVKPYSEALKQETKETPPDEKGQEPETLKENYLEDHGEDELSDSDSFIKEAEKELNMSIKELKDYSLVFDKYKEKFNKAYSLSQKLFEAERASRQTLSYYYRRNNAILDLLDDFGDNAESSDILDDVDQNRLKNVIEMNPRLRDPLSELSKVNDNLSTLSKQRYIHALITESLAEFINDDVTHLEMNPQDIEFWIRRNCPQLITSKHRLIEVLPDRARNATEDITNVPKKKRKIVKEEDGSEDPQAKKSKK